MEWWQILILIIVTGAMAGYLIDKWKGNIK